MRIHLVYAGDSNNTVTYAPFSITRNLYRALSGLADVAYYDWCSGGPFQPIEADDIIIGHPNYPEGTATRQLFKAKCRAKLLIFPLHHAMPEINFAFDDLVRQADAVLSITGPYWYDTIDKTMFAHWKSKITRVDMAIDPTHYPWVKKTFSPRGQRSFYYIGSDRPEKGVHVLRDIFAGTGHVLHLYGNISSDIIHLPNVRLHGWAETCPEWAADLAATADMHVHAGVSDANPTTLLEAACWGFPSACTPTSGYWPDRPFYGLNAADLDGCRTLLDYIQWMPDDVLALRAAAIRLDVVNNHTWDKFTSTVVDVVRRFM